MTWTIRQNGDRWEVLDTLGAVVLSGLESYEEALGLIGLALDRDQATRLATMDGGGDDGLLPETWVSPISAESADAGDGRDFTECSWSWRDPDTHLVPLMLHTETEIGHFGAQLAGFVTSYEGGGVGTVSSRGRFYDTETGRMARDLLLAGRRFGISVDPGGGTEYDYVCTEEDEDGFCVEASLSFTAYEIIGQTMTPFPGLERAHIVLEGTTAETPPAPEPPEDDGGDDGEAEDGDEDASARAAASSGSCCEECTLRARTAAALGRSRLNAGVITERAVSALAAGASFPLRPPAAWFTDPQLDRLTPLTITEDGRVFGHLAPWGQCHTGYQGECVMTPRSLTSYAYFRLGAVECDDGSEVSTGRLTYGGGHADLSLSFRGATEHYDNAGACRADVAAGEDAHGLWIAGALRPGVTDAQVRELRASSWSGDWRPVGGGLELVAALAVNSPGFPIARARVASGRVQSLVAAGASVMARLTADPSAGRLERIEAQVAALRAELTRDARHVLRQHGRRNAVARLRAHTRGEKART